MTTARVVVPAAQRLAHIDVPQLEAALRQFPQWLPADHWLADIEPDMRSEAMALLPADIVFCPDRLDPSLLRIDVYWMNAIQLCGFGHGWADRLRLWVERPGPHLTAVILALNLGPDLEQLLYMESRQAVAMANWLLRDREAELAQLGLPDLATMTRWLLGLQTHRGLDIGIMAARQQVAP